ncbi:MAG TPA: thioredoxin [Sedimenticola thiotaurini]|uniref:Thioredoxin n=1 Tax=Sedimenticola thiotaurini TaxID=1543721 RepID=A0A831RIK5_9GAMM|nr:thioredoxin [Sedimenticola thiotaurini]
MSRSDHIVEVTEANYQTVVVEGSHAVPVLVDFWADWCQPCKMLMPLLARLAEEYRGRFLLAKVNTEENQNLAMQFGIRSIPTVKLFIDGQPVDEFMGALPEAQIRAFLDRHIPRESDQLVAAAEELLRQGDAAGARETIERALGEDPDNPRVILALARLQATLGEIDQAEQTLATLPPDQQESTEAKSLKARLRFDRVALSAPPPEQLQRRLEEQPDDAETLYRLAAHRVMGNDFEQALELLLRLLQKHRSWNDDAARRGMLALFDLLGPDDPLVSRYRSRMFNALH